MKASALQLCTYLAAIAITIAPLPLHAQAQAPAAATTSSATPAYAEEPVVIEHSDTIVSVAPDGTGWKEHTLVARMQADTAIKRYGVLNVPYASSSEHVELIYVRVHHADGTVAETQTSDAMDMPSAVTRTAPFYSDQKELQLPIRSLRVGDTLDVKYRVVHTRSEIPGQFWGQEIFSTAAVVLEQSIELRVPPSIYINVWSPTAKPVESNSAATTDSPAQHIYRWTHAQLKPTAGKEAEAAVAANKKILWTADQELDLELGKLPTIAWTTFKSWDDIGAWYRSLEADRIVPDTTVKAKAAELTAGKSTDDAKVHALYDYVATNIRYIGVAFGIGRYQPHTAAEILSNQYGDCKDKHTLLAAMLAAEGIQSDAVLIGAGIRFNPAVPSPSAFNHLITHLTLAGKPVWLDTTAEVAPFGMLVSTTRDKQSLVIPPTAAPTIIRTPLEPLVADGVAMDAVGSLDAAGVSTSHIVLTFHGDGEIASRAAFRQIQPAQYDQAVQAFSSAIGFTGTVTNPEISRATDTAQPFKLSYDYKREKAGDWEHLRTIPQVIPVALPRVADIDPPVHYISLGQPRVSDSTSAMKLPEGWSALTPPEVHVKCAYATYDMSYRVDHGTLYAERRLVILQKKVPVSDWKTYKEWVDKVNPGREPYIQLFNSGSKSSSVMGALNPSPSSVNLAAPTTNWLVIRSTGGNNFTYQPAPLGSRAAPGNTDADKLIRAAYPAFDSRDFDAAQKSLDQAKALAPEQIGLWATYGMLALRRDAYADALADLQKEITLHPDQLNVYSLIDSLEKRLNLTKERLATLRTWSATTTLNPYPTTQLMIMLIDAGDPAAAVEAASIDRIPDARRREVNLQVVLGRALLLAGNPKSGAETLAAVAKQAKDPMTRNNAAYQLAVADVELPLAETASRQSVSDFTGQTAHYTLDVNADTLRTSRMQLASNWDTLGYVLFREGKFDEARSFIAAAWTAKPSDELGLHLGDILAAQGDKPAALATYELALATVPARDAANAHGLPKDLATRADAIRKAGIVSPVSDPGDALLTLRTIPLDVTDAPTGEVEYRLLLQSGKALKAEPTAAEPIPGVADAIAHADFSRLFPTGSEAIIARTAHVTCRAKSCSLILEP